LESKNKGKNGEKIQEKNKEKKTNFFFWNLKNKKTGKKRKNKKIIFVFF
jgi:hypothetical protein